MKSADPEHGWVRFHDWTVNMASSAFCDENWLGEGLCGPLANSPTHNYYDVLDLPAARLLYGKEQWGHLTSWLTELAVTAGADQESRAAVYGKMIASPKDGKPGKWTLPRWKDYEHMAGLALIHDMFQVGGNSLDVPVQQLHEIERRMGWDEHVRFLGYWELGDHLQAEGGAPEKIVCSMFYRPPGVQPSTDFPPAKFQKERTLNALFEMAEADKEYLHSFGVSPKGWLVLAPMNNTDADVTLTLRPNLKKLGFARLAEGRTRDLFRAFDMIWEAPTAWRANTGDPEQPHIAIQATHDSFPVVNGAVSVPVPKRSFRMLLLEEK